MHLSLYVFTLLFIKLIGYLPGIIEWYSLWINSYTKNYGIRMKCYIAIARAKKWWSDLKGTVRKFFNATREVDYMKKLQPYLCFHGFTFSIAYLHLPQRWILFLSKSVKHFILKLLSSGHITNYNITSPQYLNCIIHYKF